MTVFFNLEVFKSIPTSSKKLELLEIHSRRRLPKTAQDAAILRKLPGKSFLLNPLPLFTKKHSEPLFLIQYINLAGLRDYTLYSYYNQRSLDTSYYPDLDFGLIAKNPLLKLDDKHILFKFEEAQRN